MRHEELLAKIDNLTDGFKPASLLIPLLVNTKSLLAVVKLHKPELHQNDNLEGCVQCSSFSYRYVEYPCPTIQAIEKELS